MAPNPSYAEAKQALELNYAKALKAGIFTPASSPIGSLNFLLLIAWLLVCSTVSESTYQKARYVVFIVITSVSIWSVLYFRSIGIVGSIGVGLNSALCVMLAINFTLLHDPRRFRRLILQRDVPKVHSNGQMQSKQKPGEDKDPLDLIWEPMPNSPSRKLAWVLDLITCLRGVHWSWEPSAVAPHLQSPRCTSKRSTLTRSIFRLLVDYMLLDLLKCLMMADPYYIHYPDRSIPPHIAQFITSPPAVYTYRMIMGALGAYAAIDLMCTAALILQVHILGRSILGVNGDQAAFPTIWGGLRPILRHGLRGFWGETWHQLFRMHFVSIADAVANALVGGTNTTASAAARRKQAKARMIIRLTVVFLLSGALHACASFTLLGPTRPWVSFLFFAIQPLGMMFQSGCSRLLNASQLIRGPWTMLLRQGGNLAFTGVWLWYCSGMFGDDMTSGGIWMLEPIPVSLLRGLGFSSQDRRWWTW